MKYFLTLIIGIMELILIPVFWNELTTDYTTIELFIVVLSIPIMLESFSDSFFIEQPKLEKVE